MSVSCDKFMKISPTRRIIRVHYNDNRAPMDLELIGVTALDECIEKRSLFINETKPGKFHMCYAESLFDDFTTVKSLEIVRENAAK